ncbi:MAG: NAD(P)H:quinone oxidoreductase [Flavobacteriaceae bacterium]
MKDVKLAIIYYSATGTNYKLAQTAEKAAKETGATVKLLRVAETAPREAISQNEKWEKHHNATKDIPTASLDDLEWADAIIFSVPTRYGNMPSQLGSFIDTTGGLWANGKLANKVVSAMTSAANPHGGQETTLLSLYKSMCHWGAIVAAPGYTDKIQFEAGGNPYGISVADGPENVTDTVQKAITHQTQRTLQVASWVKKGSQ